MFSGSYQLITQRRREVAARPRTSASGIADGPARVAPHRCQLQPGKGEPMFANMA